MKIKIHTRTNGWNWKFSRGCVACSGVADRQHDPRISRHGTLRLRGDWRHGRSSLSARGSKAQVVANSNRGYDGRYCVRRVCCCALRPLSLSHAESPPCLLPPTTVSSRTFQYRQTRPLHNPGGHRLTGARLNPSSQPTLATSRNPQPRRKIASNTPTTAVSHLSSQSRCVPFQSTLILALNVGPRNRTR